MRSVFSPDITSGLEGDAVPAGSAFITEMFSGIQGEGPYVGVRQVFVRLGGCDLRCWWCDTPGSLVRRGAGRIEVAPSTREFIDVDNPMSLYEAEELLGRLRPQQHDSVTFTGGEPLLQPEVVLHLARSSHAFGTRTWLETHGGRVHELAEVLGEIDVVSMDIKVESSAGEWIPLEIHRSFLELAAQKDVYAKLVVPPATRDDEVIAAARMVSDVDPDIVLVLQPVTPIGRIKSSPAPARMLELQAECLVVHPSTRVIPQTHKSMGQL